MLGSAPEIRKTTFFDIFGWDRYGNQGPTVLHNQISSKLALYTKATLMEEILRNPGLQHLAEEVFWNLDVEDLKICAHINQSCKQILQNL